MMRAFDHVRCDFANEHCMNCGVQHLSDAGGMPMVCSQDARTGGVGDMWEVVMMGHANLPGTTTG
jgi:hypothetical protein